MLAVVCSVHHISVAPPIARKSARKPTAESRKASRRFLAANTKSPTTPIRESASISR